jgi:hypothetical protein
MHCMTLPASLFLSPFTIRQLCRDAVVVAGAAEIAAIGSR